MSSVPVGRSVEKWYKRVCPGTEIVTFVIESTRNRTFVLLLLITKVIRNLEESKLIL